MLASLIELRYKSRSNLESYSDVIHNTLNIFKCKNKSYNEIYIIIIFVAVRDENENCIYFLHIHVIVLVKSLMNLFVLGSISFYINSKVMIEAI